MTVEARAYIEAVIHGLAGLPDVLDDIARLDPGFCQASGGGFTFTGGLESVNVDLQAACEALGRTAERDRGWLFALPTEQALADVAAAFEARLDERGWTVLTGRDRQAHLMDANLQTLASLPRPEPPAETLDLLTETPEDRAYAARVAAWIADGLTLPRLYRQALQAAGKALP